ncbi:Alpha-1,3-mannosyltransferase-like protein [Actinomortierella wolfii]|nr:Alpha-1,3-mannosyltransferase-like protein [Actinomortierella wolfii]
MVDLPSPLPHSHLLMDSTRTTTTPLRIAFVHPDLGIGGAERLVVDAAVGLQNLGHKVVMYTSHHDPSHCFEETRDGTLTVRVGGNTIVPRTIFNRFYIVCAILRNLHLALSLLLFSSEIYDIIIVDQLSVSIPLLRWTGAKIFFYCHFPDKLLTKRDSLLKRLYRLPVDLIEELTTGMADSIVVNSKFTAQIFAESFRMLSQHHAPPDVLYPSLQLDKFDRPVDTSIPEVELLKTTKTSFVSINRYERKKDIGLAIRAFAKLLALHSSSAEESPSSTLRLVIAGGYDTRVDENVEHHRELVQLAQELGLSTVTMPKTAAEADSAQVVFLLSISDAQKIYLIQHARALLYTPTNEHFGIVPVEAMYLQCPVIAINSGGPTESIDNSVTGYLCPADPQVWAEMMQELLTKTDEAWRQMGDAGRERVLRLFSLNAFVTKLNSILVQLHQSPPSAMVEFGPTIAILSFFVLALAVLALR